jgi:hypothetical protein
MNEMGGMLPRVRGTAATLGYGIKPLRGFLNRRIACEHRNGRDWKRDTEQDTG